MVVWSSSDPVFVWLPKKARPRLLRKGKKMNTLSEKLRSLFPAEVPVAQEELDAAAKAADVEAPSWARWEFRPEVEGHLVRFSPILAITNHNEPAEALRAALEPPETQVFDLGEPTVTVRLPHTIFFSLPEDLQYDPHASVIERTWLLSEAKPWLGKLEAWSNQVSQEMKKMVEEFSSAIDEAS
jgi:hypothetical protein